MGSHLIAVVLVALAITPDGSPSACAGAAAGYKAALASVTEALRTYEACLAGEPLWRTTPARTALPTPDPRRVISELDIYRAANLLIDRHGGDALIEAARMIDRMLELGDREGRSVWRRIKAAIEQLQAAPSVVH
jgi:hypothetical protein